MIGNVSILIFSNTVLILKVTTSKGKAMMVSSVRNAILKSAKIVLK
jgi:hypothetical protein